MAFGLSALNGIEWQCTPKECLITGALPFSECNERMSLTYGLPPSHLGKVCKHTLLSVWRRFIVIQRPTGAHAILLRQIKI